jgi:hypothetical protein
MLSLGLEVTIGAFLMARSPKENAGTPIDREAGLESRVAAYEK